MKTPARNGMCSLGLDYHGCCYIGHDEDCTTVVHYPIDSDEERRTYGKEREPNDDDHGRDEYREERKRTYYNADEQREGAKESERGHERRYGRKHGRVRSAEKASYYWKSTEFFCWKG